MIIRPTIFNQFPEIVAAQSTREGGVSPMPYGMNLSSHVGDAIENVVENRRRYYEAAGVSNDARFVYQNQIHSSHVNVVRGDEGIVKESDALITSEANVLLCVSIADCTPVLIYEPKAKIIAAIHAGWRGTEQMIVLAAIQKLKELGASPKEMFAFVGASASKEKYEVGFDVATLFEKHHFTELPTGKFLLDVKGANVEQLTRSGVPQSHIEVSPLCTITDARLHSYRRDGKQSGRMLAIIGMKA
jgi:YfiH family protein